MDMTPTLVGNEVEAPPEGGTGGGGFDDPAFWGGDSRGGPAGARYDSFQTLIWVLLIPIVMLFVGLTSSLIVRKGVSNDWVPTQVPRLLWVNTAILLCSSVSFEQARRALRARHAPRFRAWLLATSGLGLAFVAGQVVAWQNLRAQGVFLSTNPSSSFFYVLTATHGTHLVGGIAALVYLQIRVMRKEFTRRRQSAFRATAVYWHFMDALWIYLLLLLSYWR